MVEVTRGSRTTSTIGRRWPRSFETRITVTPYTPPCSVHSCTQINTFNLEEFSKEGKEGKEEHSKQGKKIQSLHSTHFTYSPQTGFGDSTRSFAGGAEPSAVFADLRVTAITSFVLHSLEKFYEKSVGTSDQF